MSNENQERYSDDRLSQLLEELSVGLERGQTDRVLTAAGGLLRRAEVLAVELPRVKDALASLSPQALEGWASGLQVASLLPRLLRAADEAVEATLPEAVEDQLLWEAWALQGLTERDRLESAIRAFEASSVQLSTQATRILQRVRNEIDDLDRQLRPKARWWVGLNKTRRLERDLLNPSERDPAWWFSSRAECDALIQALSGEMATSPHFAQCSECRRDIATVAVVSERRTRHLDAEDLWRMDMDLIRDAERVAIHRHASECPECNRALLALKEGEEAIEEASTEEGVSLKSLPPLKRARRRETDELVEAHPSFRVMVHRRSTRWQLVVQPTGEEKLAAVAAFLAASPRTPIKPHFTEEGLTFDLGDGEGLDGASVTLRVQYGAEAYERAFEL